MDSSYGGSPIMRTPQNRPKWTGTIEEALACRRLRAHLDGQELGEARACLRLRSHQNGQEL